MLGVAVRDQAKLTMFSQLVFLPSILLSGIMFPSELLPGILGAAGRIFPASWGFCLMKDCPLYTSQPEDKPSGCIFLTRQQKGAQPCALTNL